MIVLVCGGRTYNDEGKVFSVLDYIHNEIKITGIVHGAASGADTLAGKWALSRSIPQIKFPAQWDLYGKSAGYIRNKEMLEKGKPNLVVAFPGGKGTANMIKLAEDANVKVDKVI
jgi:hypothetical protein